MPKVKPLTENDRRDKAFTAQLTGMMKVDGITAIDMAARLGVSLNTFYRHRDNPERMTLKEIRIIQQTFPEIVIQ